MRAMSHRVGRIRAVVSVDCTSSLAARPARWSTSWPVQAAQPRRMPSTGGAWLAVNAERCLCGSRSFSNTPGAQSGERSQAPSKPATGSEPLVSPINIPNALTLSRILATPVFIHWINLGHYDLVLGGFFAAAITDFFDGYLARKWKQITAVGSFMDPLADKVLVNGLAIPLAIQGMLPGSLVALICGRDLAIIVGVLYSRALTIEGKFTWKKYVNVSNSTPQNLKPTNISKINTVLQCTVVVLACGRGAELMAEPAWFEATWNGLLLATGGTTLWSWGDYFNHFINGNRNWQKSLENPEQHQDVINAAARLVGTDTHTQKREDEGIQATTDERKPSR